MKNSLFQKSMLSSLLFLFLIWGCQKVDLEPQSINDTSEHNVNGGGMYCLEVMRY